jgi:hypothetical protein
VSNVIELNGDVVTAEQENKITVSSASLERLQQGLSGLLRQRQEMMDKLRELETAIARQEGGIQLMQMLVEAE